MNTIIAILSPFRECTFFTGIRGININVTYKVEEDSTKFECHLEEKLNLETTEPFLIASELLR